MCTWMPLTSGEGGAAAAAAKAGAAAKETAVAARETDLRGVGGLVWI